jgi:multidrug efflux pump subunit AcrA (membrane-fusion protein)
MKMKARKLVLAVLAAIVLVSAGYWLLTPREKEVAAFVVKTAPVDRILAINGRIRPRLQVDIRPTLGGELVALPFDVGDRVAAG